MSYILSKILPLALLPLGVSLVLLLLGLIARRRWPVLAGVVLLWFFSLGLVSQRLWRWLETPWFRLAAVEAPVADAIVVLSGGHHPALGAARLNEWHDPDRFLAGLDLYRAGKAPWLLFTGGASPFSPGQPPEGLVISRQPSSSVFRPMPWPAPPRRSTQRGSHRDATLVTPKVVDKGIFISSDFVGHKCFSYAPCSAGVSAPGASGASLPCGFPGTWPLGGFAVA